MDVIVPNINKSQNSLFQYINEINKIPLLTEEQEIKYAKLKEQGDLSAAKMLVSSHLRLVVKIAFKYKNYKLPLSDLIAEGNIGLIRAVKGFRLDKGCRLSTYAIWWIKAYIQEYVLKTWSLVKIGTTVAQKKLFFNLKKIKNKILKYDQKYLSDSDAEIVAKECGVTLKDVKEMDKRLYNNEASLNEKIVNSDGKVELGDLISSDQVGQDLIVAEKIEKEKRTKLLKRALEILDERERDIICNRRLLDKSLKLKDLAEKYGISSERVRQIENRALEKMKRFVGGN